MRISVSLKAVAAGVVSFVSFGAACAISETWYYDVWQDPATGYRWSLMYGIPSCEARIYSQGVTYQGRGKAISPAPTGLLEIPAIMDGFPVSEIGERAFYNCDAMTGVVIPQGVRKIANAAFEGCCGLQTVTIPSGITNIGESVFLSCTNLTAIYVDANNRYYSSTDGVLYNKDKSELICVPAGKGGRFEVPSSVKRISKYAFYECKNLTYILLPRGLVAIGDYAFYGCENITTITLPRGLVTIGDYAFKKCKGISSVSLPDSVANIPKGLFEICEGLISVELPNSITNISMFGFGYCSSLKSIRIPESVKVIANSAFADCLALESVTLPKNVVDFGSAAFWGCTGIKKVNMPNWVNTMSVCFPDAYRTIEEIEICDGLVKVPDQAFHLCTSLVAVDLPKGVTTIGSSAFWGCTALRSVNIPYGVTDIEERAFTATGLTSVALPASVKRIGDYAFSSCEELTNVSMPYGVESIGQYAFCWCCSLPSMIVPASVQYIGYAAFNRCEKLASLSLPFIGACRGNTGEREALFGYIFGSDADLPVTRQYYSSTKYLDCAIPASLKNVTITSETIVGYGAFYGCSEVESIGVYKSTILDQGVSQVHDKAFYGCAKLYSMPLKSGLETIGSMAFYGCESLYYFSLPASLKSIGRKAFEGTAFWNSAASGCVWKNNWFLGVKGVAVPEIVLGKATAGVMQDAFIDVGGDSVVWIDYEDRDRLSGLISASGAKVAEMNVQYIPPKPVITPEDGSVFSGSTKVLITNALQSAVIHFTIDGTMPSTNSPVFKKFTATGKTIVRAIAVIDGRMQSEVASSLFAPGRVSTPCIVSEQGLTYNFSSNYVYITCDTSGASLHYTTDGSDPTPSSPLYTAPFVISDTKTIKAIATDHPDYLDSDVAIMTFTREWLQTPAPSISTSGGKTIFNFSGETVTLACDLEGAEIYYTLDGSFPTEKSLRYTGPFTIDTTTTVRAIAVKADYLKSEVTAMRIVREWVPVSAPEITNASGGLVFNFSGETITIACAMEGVTMYYTTDGTTPTVRSQKYVGPFVINDTTTVRVLAEKHDYSSVVKTVTVRRNWIKTNSPTAMSATGGAVFHFSGEVVTLGCDMEGATIYYTLDGSTPTKNSTRYDGPFTIDDTTTIKMISVKADYSDSDVTTVTFTREWFAVDAPQVETIYGSLEDGDETDVLIGSFLWVKMNCPTEGAAIHYTMDGSAPTVTSPVYEEPFKVTDSVVIKAIAVKDDWRDSSVASATVTKKWTDGDSLNSPDMTFSGDGTAVWTTDTEVSHDGVASMKSGEIGNDQTSVIQTVVNGSGKVIFWWKASCEQTDLPPYWWDYGSFMIGSEEVAWIDGITDWRRCEVRVEGTGDHVLKWKYEKDSSDREGGDCIWLDQFTWIPDAGNATTKKGAVEVPYKWLDDYGLLAEYDPEVVVFRETGKTDGAGKALTVMDEFVAGTNPNDPASKFSVKIEVVDGKPVVTWDPALNGEGVKTGIRSYTIQGSNDLKEWSDVPDGKESEYHYFKAKVGMP